MNSLKSQSIFLFSFLTLLSLICSRRIIIPTRGDTGEHWILFAGGPERSNYLARTIDPPLKLDWIFKASSAIGKTLLSAHNTLFLATLDGKIFALDANSGKKLGQLHVKDGIEATCVYFNQSLIFALRYGKRSLYRYDLRSGTYLWKKDLGSIDTEPLIYNNKIYIATLYKGLYCLNISDGSEIWHVESKQQFHSSPALSKDRVVVGCDDKKIYAFDSRTGKLLWQYSTGGSVLATPTISDSVVYIGSTDNYFYSLNLNDGTLNWKYRTQGRIVSAAAASSTKVVFGSHSKVYAVDKKSGRLAWSFAAESIISTSPLICDHWVYFGSLDHYLYAIDVRDGKLVWKFKTKGRIRTSPIPWGNRLFIASEDKYLYAFTQEK